MQRNNMPFETKLNEMNSGSAPSYEDEEGPVDSSSSDNKLTPKEYPHSGDPATVPPSYRSAAYNHQYWDGHSNQWQYYNPSSDYYASHRYYPPPPPDPYFRRDYDPYAPPRGYGYSVQYPYHHPPPPPESISRTPTGAIIHPVAVGQPIPSAPNDDQHSYPRSPKRRRTDGKSASVTAADIILSDPKKNTKIHKNCEGEEKASRENYAMARSYYEPGMPEIEPAPLASSTNDQHYGHIYSNSGEHYPPAPHHQQQYIDQIPLSSSSSSTKRSLTYVESGGPYYPNTPFTDLTDVKQTFESGQQHPPKTFVTPEHLSADHTPSNNDHENNNHVHHPFHNDDDDIHGGLVIPSPASSTHSEHRYGEDGNQKNSSSLASVDPDSLSKRPLTDRKQLQSKAWYERFNDLKKYKEQHGDCLVPQKYPPNPSLGIWVNKQRMEYKLLQDNEKSSMSEDRLAALRSIGFVWAKRKGQATWDTKFKQLIEYKAHHGDCLIPTKYSKNPALGRWVSTQREQYRMWKAGNPKSKMTPEKARMLDDIGFVWRLQF